MRGLPSARGLPLRVARRLPLDVVRREPLDAGRMLELELLVIRTARGTGESDGDERERATSRSMRRRVSSGREASSPPSWREALRAGAVAIAPATLWLRAQRLGG